MDKQTIGMLLVFGDFLVLLAYLIFLAMLKNFQRMEVKEIKGEIKKCQDFSLQLCSLPEGIDNMHDLKAELWWWFEKRLQQIEQTGKGTMTPKIVDIYFGTDNYSHMQALKKVRAQETVVLEQRIEMQQNPKKDVVIYRDMQKDLQKLKKAIDNYEKKEKERPKKMKPLFAFIIFLNMEDSQKILKFYSKNCLERAWMKLRNRSAYQMSLLMDQWPVIKRAP